HVELAPPRELEVAVAGGEPIDPRHLVAIVLEAEGVAIGTEHFLSKDAGRTREGILRLRVNGQETVLPYAGRGLVRPKFRSKLLYLGAPPPALALDLALVELDERV